MRWPWTSVARLDDVKQENGWLRARVEELEGQVIRIQRRREGLPEAPREPKPEPKPIPQQMLEYINSIGHPGLRRDIRNRALQRHRKGESWPEIEEDLLVPKEPLSVAPTDPDGGTTDE